MSKEQLPIKVNPIVGEDLAEAQRKRLTETRKKIIKEQPKPEPSK
jgi:hypothetical protein